jgi:hypothetical protein
LSLAGLVCCEGETLRLVREKENKPVRSALDDHGGDLGEMKQKSEL